MEFKTRHDLINALTLNKEFRMFFEETPVARLDGVTHLHRLLYSGNLDEQGLVFDYMRSVPDHSSKALILEMQVSSMEGI